MPDEILDLARKCGATAIAQYVADRGWITPSVTFTPDQLRSFVEAIREKTIDDVARDADKYGNALNEAGWEAIEAYRRHIGENEPPCFFNHAKSILRDAFRVYFAAIRQASTEGGGK